MHAYTHDIMSSSACVQDLQLQLHACANTAACHMLVGASMGVVHRVVAELGREFGACKCRLEGAGAGASMCTTITITAGWHC